MFITKFPKLYYNFIIFRWELKFVIYVDFEIVSKPIYFTQRLQSTEHYNKSSISNTSQKKIEQEITFLRNNVVQHDVPLLIHFVLEDCSQKNMKRRCG